MYGVGVSEVTSDLQKQRPVEGPVTQLVMHRPPVFQQVPGQAGCDECVPPPPGAGGELRASDQSVT